jgi:hypothetical protein
MVLISHRGNTNGPDSCLENNPGQVQKLLNRGIQVEIDVCWAAGNFYLGHDKPVYAVEVKFLQQAGLWLHAKDSGSIVTLLSLGVNCFWHQNDYFTLTSGGYIWAHPKSIPSISYFIRPEMRMKIVVVNLEKNYNLSSLKGIYGLCTDYL